MKIISHYKKNRAKTTMYVTGYDKDAHWFTLTSFVTKAKVFDDEASAKKWFIDAKGGKTKSIGSAYKIENLNSYLK